MTFDMTLAYDNTYEMTISRINKFISSLSNAFITFIIPSINRKTLFRTLISILEQTDSNWRAIIIFDGCEPTDESLLSILQDERFLYISIKHIGTQGGECCPGQAGFVRNIGMQFVQTPWIGFIDDDDTIVTTYLEHLKNEINITPSADVISFKMICDGEIFPPINYSQITQNTIGISFAMKSSLIKEGFTFKQSTSEDFRLLNDLQKANKIIVLSPHVTYRVRATPLIEHELSQRFIVHKLPDSNF